MATGSRTWRCPASSSTTFRSAGPQVDILRGSALGTYTLQTVEVSTDPNEGLAGPGTDVVAGIVRQPQVGGRMDLLMAMSVQPNLQGTFVLLNNGSNPDGTINWTTSRE